MLIHASTRTGRASELPGEAHIVLTVDPKSSAVGMQAFFRGRMDSIYAPVPPSRLVAELEKLIAELREQSV